MKRLIPILLVVLLSNCANADIILFYKGVMSLKTEGDSQTSGVSTPGYILYDIEGITAQQPYLQFVLVNYGSTKASGRFYHVNAAGPYQVSITDLPRSKKHFIFSDTISLVQNSTSFSYSYSFMSGVGDYPLESVFGMSEISIPRSLKYSLSVIAENSANGVTVGEDCIQTKGTGTFTLSIPLLKESIAAGESLSAATARVTNLLEGEGYKQQ